VGGRVAMERGNDNRADGNTWREAFEYFKSSLTLINVLFFVLITAVIILLAVGLFSSDESLLKSLQSNENARGVITFLVVFTTVSIALVLALYAIVSERDDQQLKDRFGFAKEILTALIGIVGTILGFYFASSTQITTREAIRSELASPQALQVASAFISNENPKKGDTVVLSSFVSGGKPPYVYSVSFSPPHIISPIADRTSPDGMIKEEVKVPESVQKDTEFTFKIAINDSSGKSSVYDDKTKMFLVKAQ
jgi:amino acid transporter